MVDKDRENGFLLNPESGNFSVDQVESETEEQILGDLDGYIALQ